MVKKGIFNDPIAPKERKSSSTFAAPTFDEQRTSGKFMAAGDYYGTGFKAPVGKIRGGSPSRNPIPQKSLRKPPESLA